VGKEWGFRGEGGAPRRVTAAEAFLLQLTKRGLEGDCAATRASLTAIEKVRERPGTYQGPSVIIRTIVAAGSATSALEALRMAKKLDPYRETARMALEPWLVEAALARLDRRLSPLDQRTIVKATRTPLVDMAGSGLMSFGQKWKLSWCNFHKSRMSLLSSSLDASGISILSAVSSIFRLS
jgi:hypothetical protein